MLIIVMLHRSAAELEPRRAVRLRTAVAVGVPFALVTVAGLLLIALAQDALPNSQILRVMPVIWAVVALITAISRASGQRLERARRQNRSTSELAASAEFGWISALLQDSSEYVFVIDVAGTIVYASPRSVQRLAPAPTLSALVCDTAADVPTLLNAVLAGSVPKGPYDMLLRGADGSPREVEVYLRTIREVSFEGFVVTGTDVTDTRRLVEQLDLTHRHDALTGLLTHDAFVADVAAAQRGTMPTGVAVLDVNDLGCGTRPLAAREVTRSCRPSPSASTRCLPRSSPWGGSPAMGSGCWSSAQPPDRCSKVSSTGSPQPCAGCCCPTTGKSM